jgi:hypothetical protein
VVCPRLALVEVMRESRSRGRYLAFVRTRHTLAPVRLTNLDGLYLCALA